MPLGVAILSTFLALLIFWALEKVTQSVHAVRADLRSIGRLLHADLRSIDLSLRKSSGRVAEIDEGFEDYQRILEEDQNQE